MKELFYTDDFFGIYEKQDEDNVRCVAIMDSEAAPDLTPAETEHYAKLFVEAPNMRELLQRVMVALDPDKGEDGVELYDLTKRIQYALDRTED